MSTATDPARAAVAVTPSDSTSLSGVRALYIGGDGNVALIAIGSSVAVTFSGLTAGAILPVQCRKVMSTNTTATNIVALS